MTQDKTLICSVFRWPRVDLHMKTQPWVEPREFGIIKRDKLTRVYNKESSVVEDFATVDELVQRWSVD